MLKFSCADFTFPLLPVHRMLQLLPLLDINAVDIGLFARSDHYSPDDLLPEPHKFADRVNHQLKEHGITPADVFLQIGPEPGICPSNEPDHARRQRNRDVFAAAVEFTAAIGCHHMTGLPGVPLPKMSERKAFDLAAEEAAWRVEVAGKSGITYSIEAHIGSICPNPESALHLLHSVGGLTLTLDYGHFIAAGIPNEDVHILVPYASHVHVRSGCPRHLQATIEDNTIDFRGLIRRLEASEYRGYLALEYVWINWQGCNRTDNISETLLLRRQIESEFARLE